MGEKWILKSEKRINLEGDHKKFKISDKHIEVERTEFFIQLIFGVAGLAFLVLLNILENFGDLVVVFLGICALVLLKKMTTIKMSKDLHLLFLVVRDKKHDEYFAIDLETNEILYVQHIFSDPAEENDAVYYFSTVDLDKFKDYVKKYSSSHYEQVKDVTSDNIDLLKNIQFSEIS